MANRKGYKHTPEARARIAAAARGHVVTDEMRSAISTKLLGHAAAAKLLENSPENYLRHRRAFRANVQHWLSTGIGPFNTPLTAKGVDSLERQLRDVELEIAQLEGA